MNKVVFLFFYILTLLVLSKSDATVGLPLKNVTVEEDNVPNLQPGSVLQVYNVTIDNDNVKLHENEASFHNIDGNVTLLQPMKPYNVTLQKDDNLLQNQNITVLRDNVTLEIRNNTKFHHDNGTLHFGNITLLLDNATYRQDQGQMLTEYNLTYYGNMEQSNTIEAIDSEETMMRPTYWLHTRETGSDEKQLDIAPDFYWNIDMIGVRERDTKILIHGWDTSRFSKFSTQLKNTFLKEMDVNVILVDWNLLADQSYHTAKDNIAHAARYIGAFIKYLVDQQGINLDKIHMIGFGLGAHLAGLSAKTLSPRKVYAITGLDPVSGLSNMGHTKRLARTDATYVEVIHTGARRFLGSYSPLGHADFYPNGGKLQPGCGLDLSATCSGDRALELYKASLEARGPVFLGVKCRTKVEAVQRRCSSLVHAAMGGKEIMRSSGIYYLQTKAYPPFY